MNSDPREIHFKRPRFFSNAFLQLNIGVLVGLAGSVLMIKTGPGSNVPVHWLAVAFFVPFLAIVFIERLVFMRRRVKPIRFEDGHLLLPNGSESTSWKKVPYPHVCSFDVRGKPGRQSLIVDTKSRMFAYPLKDFRKPDAVDTFGRLLRERIDALPNGERHWQDLVDRQKLAGLLPARRYPVTALLLGMVAIVYVIQMLAGAEHNSLKLIELGANVRSLVGEGQWYRLVAANFLHAGPAHVMVNGVALWLLGAMLERLTGSLRFLLIFMASGLLGAICSAIFMPALVSVGASTCVFGLLGALAFINWRFRGELPGGYRIPVRSWLILLGVNAALPILVPQIDIFAHLGGFSGGALTAFVIYGKQGSLREAPLYTKYVNTAAVVLAGVFLLGGAQAVTQYPDTIKHDKDRTVMAQALLQSPSGNAGLLNNVAWWLAIEPSSTFDALQAARGLAERAVDIANRNGVRGDVATYLDTLATTHYRLGDFDKAIEIEREVFSRESNPMHAGQLARFLKARVESDGPYVLGNIALPDIGIRKPASDDEPLIVDIARPIPQGLTLYAYALDSAGRIRGLLHLTVPPGHEPGRYLVQPEPATAALLAGSERVQTALIDAGGCRCSQRGIDMTFHAYDESVSDLP